MKVYVLTYGEWECDGYSGTYDNVIASLDREKLVEHKHELEKKSEEIRDRIRKLEEERDEKLQPLWKELRPLITKKSKQPHDLTRKKELQMLVSEIHTEFYNAKEAMLKEFNVEYYIDDPDLAEFAIDELEVLE